MNYYNEHDPYCAQWLRNLIAAELIPPGVVDDRDIRDVRAIELAGFAQCHFFAGLGGWPRALALAGVGADRPLWTGSCPCQPFSAAGKRLGVADQRHLWPIWHWLIGQCRPPVVLGEQVAHGSRDWQRLVHGDLEALGYAVGGICMEAASVGAPHLRDRFWFVAKSDGQGGHARAEHAEMAGAPEPVSDSVGAVLWQQPGRGSGPNGAGASVIGDDGKARHVAHSDQPRLAQWAGLAGDACPQQPAAERAGWWVVEPDVDRSFDGLPAGMDGGSPWADGWEDDIPRTTQDAPARVAKLRALGNAIVPACAAAFIAAALLAGCAVAQLETLRPAEPSEVPAIAGKPRVIDGDTLAFAGRSVRLAGIDAPELAQRCGEPVSYRCGELARQQLRLLIEDDEVACYGEQKDTYQRLLAVCFVRGEDIAHWLVSNGLALADRKYSEAYVGAETVARVMEKGMWSGVFDTPWDWRARRRK